MPGGNFFTIPGQSELDKNSLSYSRNPAPADKTLVQSRKDGAGRGPARKQDDSQNQARRDEEDREKGEQANTPPAEPPKDRTVVKITNLKWDRGKVSIGGTAIVSMVVAIPKEHEHTTKITCVVEQQMSGGAWKPPGSNTAGCDVDKEGKAVCELAIPEPIKNQDGTLPAKVNYRFTAKHAYSDPAKGPTVEAVPGGPESPFDSVIYYSPAKQEYLVFETEDDFKSLLPELEKMDRLKAKSGQALKATDPSLRRKTQEEIEKEADELFDGEVIGEADVMEELLLVRRNPRWGKASGWIYIRPHAKKNGTQVKGYRRKDSDKTLKKNLEDLLKKAPGSKELSPLFGSNYKVNLFKTDPLQSQKILWHDKVEKDGKLAGRPFSYTREAAVCRLMMNWDGAEASFDPKEKKIKIGTGGNLSFGLLEGKMEGKFPLPEQGVNLLDFLKRTTPLAAVIREDRRCQLRLNVTLTAKAFAGMTVNGALNVLEVDLSKVKAKGKKKDGAVASSGVSANAFAGAQASAGLEVATEWAADKDGKFAALGSCGVEGGGSAGLGAGTEWTLEYRNGTFHFTGGSNLTIGLGCKGSFSFELDVEEGCRLAGHLFHCMDFHYVEEVHKLAFTAYKNFTFTAMVLGEAVFLKEKKLLQDVITKFPKWLSENKGRIQKFKSDLWTSTGHSSALNNVPPEALGQALVTLMQTREPEDFRSILGILYSTVRRKADPKTDPSANHKLKWTLRYASGTLDWEHEAKVTDPEKDEALKKGIKKIMDFGYGLGYLDKVGNKQNRNKEFMDEFQEILKRNGVN